ncbi:MAG: c-type cytochrome [Gammaproteobacteria bacterium]|nr:c-type cytochrome [Gammaproteobacteria bacterium]MCF6229203.1 c-type cytochrome [Gammaproteobacteria bacterium]
MLIKKQWLTIAVALLIAGQTNAADIAAGEAFSANCTSCHGNNGISPSAEVPNLAGQLPDYIVKRVNSFRDARQGDSLMHGLANLLNNPQDIENVAAYYGSLPRARYRSSNKSLIEAGKKVYFSSYNCSMCHGSDGMGEAPTEGATSPMVVGQSKRYIVKALYDFRTSKRTSNEGYMMNLILPSVSEESIDAVAEYLSSQ